MSTLLWAGAVFAALVVLRFLQPELLHRLRQFLVRARVNRAMLDRDKTPIGRDRLGELLSVGFQSDCAGRGAAAMEARCGKVRELFSVLTSDEFGERGHPRVGMGLVELANMLEVLGNRFKAADERRSNIVDAGQVLAFVARSTHPDAASVDELTVEDWLARHPTSVSQVGELLMAAIFCLTRRETPIYAASAPEARSEPAPLELAD